jgi:hypothetical protein
MPKVISTPRQILEVTEGSILSGTIPRCISPSEVKPLAIDLFCGLGGWAQGLLATGWDVIGFDIEARPYPGQLVLQDVLTIHGSQFKRAGLIVCSPPCQNYSYLAMPWSRSKNPEGSKAAKALRRKWETEGPDNRLFDACFRIQREAIAAAGRHIPLIVENVRGAQPWVGQAKANYGSFFLWGDVETVNGAIVAGQVRFGVERMSANGGVKIPGQDWNRFKNHGDVSPDWTMQVGRKVDHHLDGAVPEGTGKTSWFFGNTKHELRGTSSGSTSRKEASARIAMIPPPLAEYIGRQFYQINS